MKALIAKSRVCRDSFQAHLERIRAETRRKTASIGDVTNGAVLVHEKDQRWVFLLPDMTEQGKWRIQRFDVNGFSGHGIYDTQQELVEAAAGQGFYTHDTGALDRVQKLKSFQLGNYWSDLIRQVNAGELSFAEAHRLVAEHNSQPS